MQDGWKAVWNIPYVSVAFFPSLKQNFMTYCSSKVSWCPDCIFEIHQLWQSGFSRVYSDCCCSCWFKPEIIKIDQSSHKMYCNNMLNFQESTPILNGCTINVWKLIEATAYLSNCSTIRQMWHKVNSSVDISDVDGSLLGLTTLSSLTRPTLRKLLGFYLSIFPPKNIGQCLHYVKTVFSETQINTVSSISIDKRSQDSAYLQISSRQNTLNTNPTNLLILNNAYHTTSWQNS